jgi:hypothetical protein
MTSYTPFAGITTDASSKIKLFFFPNAGGTTARYITWNKRLPAAIEVIPVAYPGRGPKSAAPLCQSLEALLQALLVEIESQLTYMDAPSLPSAQFVITQTGLRLQPYIRTLCEALPLSLMEFADRALKR